MGVPVNDGDVVPEPVHEPQVIVARASEEVRVPRIEAHTDLPGGLGHRGQHSDQGVDVIG
jgi:hypothetical protein